MERITQVLDMLEENNMKFECAASVAEMLYENLAYMHDEEETGTVMNVAYFLSEEMARLLKVHEEAFRLLHECELFDIVEWKRGKTA